MGSSPKIQQPAAPAPVDPAKSSIDYLRAMSDPALQQRLLEAEQTYRPQYVDLEIADINRYGDAIQGMTERNARSQSQIAIEAQSAQREADIADVERFGGRASQAFLNANPQLRAQMEANQSLRSSGDPYAQLQAALSAGGVPGGDITAERVSAGTVTPQQVDQGALGLSLYQQALSANGVGQVAETLQGRAQQLAQSTGALTPEEIRSLQQSTRAAYAARGTEMGSGSVSAEALARLTNERQRMQEDLGMASSINQLYQQELGANRNFAGNIQAQELARQQSNVAGNLQAQLANQQGQLQAGLANQQTMLGAQESNRAFGAAQYQQNIGNLGMLGQLQQSQLQSDRGYGLQLAAQQASVASDPFQAILGRPSNAPGMGMAQSQFAAGLGQSQTGPNLFNVDTGINLAMQNQANQTNYQSNIFGAQAGLAGARSGANGQMIGAGLGAAAGIGLAIF
jgi:hypothetical protein